MKLIIIQRRRRAGHRLRELIDKSCGAVELKSRQLTYPFPPQTQKVSHRAQKGYYSAIRFSLSAECAERRTACCREQPALQPRANPLKILYKELVKLFIRAIHRIRTFRFFVQFEAYRIRRRSPRTIFLQQQPLVFQLGSKSIHWPAMG